MKKLLHLSVLPALLLAANTLISQNYNLTLRATLDFPGQTLANVCGYTAPDGSEYALVGGSKGLIIIDISNPDAPEQIVQIPGPDNLWKEIKTYRHFAYVTSEGGGGVQIVDLSGLPDGNINYQNYTGDGNIFNNLNQIHALHIDTTRGYLYAYGANNGNLFNGGAVVLNLNPDPYNPVFAGSFGQLGYIHDGYADNDTLYGCHIEQGYLSIVDMSDKANPVALGTVETPARFTHNSWMLGDRKHILTTDEKVPSFLTAYDISDPQDIKELDRFSPNDGFQSIGHNTHVINNFAVTSWYTDGVSIVDAHRPDNLVQVGYYDTWPGTGPSFDGCWGVYPFFPSGTVIASNIQPARLFILKPTYVRAAYLEGQVTDGCTGQALIGASVKILNGDPLAATTTQNNGSFKTGQRQTGAFTVEISKPGYVTQTFNVNLAAAQVSSLNVVLERISAVNISGQVRDNATQQPIPNASILLANAEQQYPVQTNGNGQFNLDCVSAGQYTVIAGAWGYLPATISIVGGTPVQINLQKGYYDDFALNYNWTTASTASAGAWELGNPNGTTNNDQFCNPEDDASVDFNERCFVTGNGGGNAGTDDVDNGTVTLTTPVMRLAGYNGAKLNFYYWFYNGGGTGSPLNDQFEVRVTNGVSTATIFTQTASESAWRFSGDIELANFITLNDNVKVQFITADQPQPNGHLVEAAVDVFRVTPGSTTSLSQTPDPAAELSAQPNPSVDAFNLRFAWPGAGDPVLEVRNTVGQLVLQQVLGAESGRVQVGADWPRGLYFATLRDGARGGNTIKLVKQ